MGYTPLAAVLLLVSRLQAPTCPLQSAASPDPFLRVSAGDVKLKEAVKPRYPDAARLLRIEERCDVHFVIDGYGRPTDVEVTGCDPFFHGAAEKAAWKWRFHPFRDGDHRLVSAAFTLAFDFQLRDSP